MTPVYAFDPIPESKRGIFLAGPTPRDADTPSWRPHMLGLLALYDGAVFVPEAAPGKWEHDYDGQAEWELAALDAASVIAFWIPRDLVRMPAFTTNIEFGYWCRSGKCLLGHPPGTPKMGYLRLLAARHGIPLVGDIDSLAALAMCRVPA